MDFDDDDRPMHFVGISPEGAVRMFADGQISKSEALNLLEILTKGEGRHDELAVEIEQHDYAKEEAERTINGLKLVSPVEVLASFENGTLPKELAHQILNFMKFKEMREEEAKAEGTPTEQTIFRMKVGDRMDAKYGPAIRKLYELVDQQEKTNLAKGKMRPKPPQVAQTKAPKLTRRS